MDTSKFSNNENIELDINTLKNAVNFDEFVKTLQKNLIPTDEFEGFKIRPGFYLENGAVVIPGGVNFTIHSQNATSCKLLLFKPAMCEPYAVIPFPEYYRIGNVYSMIVLGLDIEEFEYAYNVDGPYIPERGLVFDSSKFLLDPYSKAIAGQSVWGTKTICGNQYKSRVVSNDFDWGTVKDL